MQILFRADGSSSIGLGHLNRCMVLAEELEERGADTMMLVRDNNAAREFLQKENARFIPEEYPVCRWPDADACILDLYGVRAPFLEELHARYGKVIAFDDGYLEHDPGVTAVINYHLYADATGYPSGKKTFLGPSYYLLRRDFTDSIPAITDKTNVFVCMGGSDPENQTSRIVDILLKTTSRHIDVVLGPGFEDTEVVTRLENNPRVFLHHSPKRLARLLSRSAYAVTGAGTMLYELAFLKVPTACLVLADNQRRTAHAFMERKAAFNLGNHTTATDDELAVSLRKFEDERFRREMSHNAGTVIDGRGAGRLADSLVEWLSSSEGTR